MTVEIISRSISTKVWDRAGFELATPGSAVRHTSVARQVTDCATRPGKKTTCIHPKLDLVNKNAYVKFGENQSICSRDIELILRNFGINQGP